MERTTAAKAKPIQPKPINLEIAISENEG